MTYCKQLNGIDSLGSLPSGLSKLISSNKSSLNKTLKRAEKLNGLGNIENRKNLLSTSEVINRYNSGISDYEIQAWVWYRRSIGVPMTGWEKYYIDIKTGGQLEEMLVATETTIVKDNHWRDLKTVPKGTILGKRLGTKEHKSNDNETYIFYRDNEGIKIAPKKHVKLNKSIMQTDTKQLDRLVKVGALYYLNGELLPYPVYAYANMYDRELELRNDKAIIIKTYGHDVYDKHVQLIKENKPKALSILNPNENERQQILAISDYASSFIISDLKPETGITLNEPTELFSAYAKYLMELDVNEFDKVTGSDIVVHYLKGKQLPRDMEKELKGQFRSDIRNEGEKLFKKFLHEALLFEDQQKLDIDWNRKYNGIPSVAHHKIPIGFEMSAKFKGFDLEIRPPQREGIAFMELVGSGIIAYDVGVGKTITAIIELANAINSGKCKRPLVAVPNPTYKNWIVEIIGDGKNNEGVLTGTGVTLNDWFNLGAQIVPGINLEKAVPEKSITLVTYEGLKKIGFGESVSQDLFNELVEILNQDTEDKSERDKEKEIQKYWERIGVGLKDTIADIDVLGFDYVVIDEAHNFKNVFNGVRKDSNGRKRFGTQGGQSDQAIKAFFLNNYIQRKYGKNIMLLTATPFTNSPLEVFSMLSHVAYQGLRSMGYYNIKDFFEMFVQETTVDAVNYKEEIVQKDVVKSFNNRLILQKLIYNHINYKTGDEAGVKRPCKVNLPKTSERKADGSLKKLAPSKQILTYLKMTPRQRSNQNDILEYAHAASSKKGGGDILRAMNMSLNNALSPYLYDNIPVSDYNEFVEESPKIHYTCEAIRSVKKWHEDRKEPVSGQVIYANRGKDYFQYIKEYLIHDVGYKENIKFGRNKFDEVEMMTGGMNPNRKEAIKDAFNEGIVKIIIGTATIREGINLQKKGTVIYNLYPDWNPTDLQQLEGRIWRQGNQYGYVRVVMPLVQDSMDVFVFQKIEEKTSRINDIWYRGDRGNVLDLESLDAEEVKYALLTDIDAIAKTVINKDVEKQNRVCTGIEYNIARLQGFTRHYNNLEHYRELLKTNIENTMRNFSDVDYIKNTPNKEQLKQYDADKRKKIASDIEKYNDLKKAYSTTPIDDKELIRISRVLSRLFSYFNAFVLSSFSESLSKVKKAERSILEPKGFKITDDIDKIIESYRKDLEYAKKDLDFFKGDEHRMNVVSEVREKKSAMKINGKGIYERVKEFSELNYLLSYRFSQTDISQCQLPKTEAPRQVEVEKYQEKKPNQDKGYFKKKFQVKAKAAKAKLALLNI